MRGEGEARSARGALQSGGRVYLRLPVYADGTEFQALRRVSADFHGPWEPTPAVGSDPFSDEAFTRYLRDSDTERKLRTVLCRHEDHRIIGAFNWNEILRGPLQSAYLGYWIGAEFANQGYMREGMRIALQHTFTGLGLHRVEANVRPENEPSIALVRSAGFKKEGFSPRYLKIDGDWRDHERWALLVDDWRAQS